MGSFNLKRNLPTNSHIGLILTNRDYHQGGSGSLVEFDSMINFWDDYSFNMNFAKSNTQEGSINFFDTADTYGETDSEVFLGRALGDRRNQIVLASKFGWEIDESHRGAHPDYVRNAIEDSLRRLGTDRIDLYQLHKPDPTVPIEETLGALDDLVSAGKVREIGCSNFSAEQLRTANSVAGDRARFVSA